MMDDKNIDKTTAHSGYSDEELEMLCELTDRLEHGVAPWATWESECRSHGKTFRKWANYPKILPLYFCSDHGVQWGTQRWPNETENRYTTYFTWNNKKSDLLRKNHGRNAYHVPHPWVFYRKKYFPILPQNRLGTLVFFTHSNSGTTPIIEDLDKYISELKSLPEKYQPVVICLGDHDVKQGLHKTLRKYKIPLVTIGSSNSQKFVDRFYSLVYQFQYSSSQHAGSQAFYIIEAGVPYFLFGPSPIYQFKGSKFIEDGKYTSFKHVGDEEDLAGFRRFQDLLSVPSDEVTPEQYAMVSKYLGMDSEMTRFKATLIVWEQLFLHFGELVVTYKRLARRIVLKISSLATPK